MLKASRRSIMSTSPQPGQCYMIPIGRIYWTQASISSTFRDPPYERLRTWHLRLRRMPLQERLAFINDLDVGFPPIRIVGFSSSSFWPDNQRWFSLDNRRLWVYRSVLPPETQIYVRIATRQEAAELINKLTTSSNGETVIVRGDERRRQTRTVSSILRALYAGYNCDERRSTPRLRTTVKTSMTTTATSSVRRASYYAR